MNIMEIRYKRLRDAMAEKGLDAVYVIAPENYLYMSHFDNPDGYMLITLDKSWLFADFRYFEAAKLEAFSCCTVCEPGKPKLSEIVNEYNLKTIGYEDRALTCYELTSLKEQLNTCEFVPTGNMFSQIRAAKTPDEIEAVTKAQRIAEGAFHHLLSMIHYDMTETDVVAELEYFMKKNGSEKPSFDTIAVSGTQSSRPHGVPRPVKLEKGFLTMDYGAMIEGYHSDMTRTICIGKADAEMKKVYNTVLEAQLAALEFVEAGKVNSDVDKVARDIINAAGYEGCFGHGLGHGVGLLIHEAPNLNARATDLVLHTGELVTVEPGVYLEGKYGCRIEDMVYLSENGKINLTDCPKELIEI
ncbi:MAG: aminopeptidase P family protein [Ruminococcaceae bacterium]|nr:aminopeptidase P family protein [Oscillospiraceae bacterium]